MTKYGPERLRYYQIYPAEMMADRNYSQLPLEHGGILFRFMNVLWSNGGSLPNDPKLIANWLGIRTAKWLAFEQRFGKIVEVEPGRISIRYMYDQYKLVSSGIATSPGVGASKKGGKVRAATAERDAAGHFTGWHGWIENEPSHAREHKHKLLTKTITYIQNLLPQEVVRSLSEKQIRAAAFLFAAWEGIASVPGSGLKPASLTKSTVADLVNNACCPKATMKNALHYIQETQWPRGDSSFVPSFSWFTKPENLTRYAEYYTSDHPESLPCEILPPPEDPNEPPYEEAVDA